jgi:hypothetical protein
MEGPNAGLRKMMHVGSRSFLISNPLASRTRNYLGMPQGLQTRIPKLISHLLRRSKPLHDASTECGGQWHRRHLHKLSSHRGSARFIFNTFYLLLEVEVNEPFCNGKGYLSKSRLGSPWIQIHRLASRVKCFPTRSFAHSRTSGSSPSKSPSA